MVYAAAPLRTDFREIFLHAAVDRAGRTSYATKVVRDFVFDVAFSPRSGCLKLEVPDKLDC